MVGLMEPWGPSRCSGMPPKEAQRSQRRPWSVPGPLLAGKTRPVPDLGEGPSSLLGTGGGVVVIAYVWQEVHFSGPALSSASQPGQISTECVHV